MQSHHQIIAESRPGHSSTDQVERDVHRFALNVAADDFRAICHTELASHGAALRHESFSQHRQQLSVCCVCLLEINHSCLDFGELFDECEIATLCSFGHLRDRSHMSTEIHSK